MVDKEGYYEEGDICPKCKTGMLVIMQERETGWNDIKCQDCFYIATDDVAFNGDK